MEERCLVCNAVGRVRCEKCESVGIKKSYCTTQHLNRDAKNHKKECKAIKIATNDKFGRHIIAKRDIKKGETIIVEKPIVTAPDEDFLPSCLSCWKRLDENKYKCSKCGWPMCNKRCEKKDAHKAECKYTDKNGIIRAIFNYEAVHPFYNYVGILRCLYLRDEAPEKYAALLKMDAHLIERTKRGDHKVADDLKERFKLNDFTLDEVRHIGSVWDVNKVCLQDTDIMGVYDICSLFAHNCISNAYKSFNRQEHIVIRASVDIQKDEIITICYVNQATGNVQRRGNLNAFKYFICDCDRCLDATEFGANLDGMLCLKCKDGVVLPPTDICGYYWECQKCGEKRDTEEVGLFLADMHENVNECIESGEYTKFLDESKALLTENHYLRVQVKARMILSFNSSFMLFNKDYVEDQKMEEKHRLVMELLKLCDLIQKGHGQFRGALVRILQHILVWKCGRLGFGIDEEKAAVLKELNEVRNIVNIIFTPETLLECDLGILQDSALVTAMINSQYKPKS